VRTYIFSWIPLFLVLILSGCGEKVEEVKETVPLRDPSETSLTFGEKLAEDWERDNSARLKEMGQELQRDLLAVDTTLTEEQRKASILLADSLRAWMQGREIQFFGMLDEVRKSRLEDRQKWLVDSLENQAAAYLLQRDFTQLPTRDEIERAALALSEGNSATALTLLVTALMDLELTPYQQGVYDLLVMRYAPPEVKKMKEAIQSHTGN